MGRSIVKLAEDEYVEWSTVVDAPITTICTRGEMEKFLRDEYGRVHEPEIPKRLERADKNGHSSLMDKPQRPEAFIVGNRAGPKETELTLEELREQYREETYNE